MLIYYYLRCLIVFFDIDDDMGSFYLIVSRYDSQDY